jgi:hypothetical protein
MSTGFQFNCFNNPLLIKATTVARPKKVTTILLFYWNIVPSFQPGSWAATAALLAEQAADGIRSDAADSRDPGPATWIK